MRPKLAVILFGAVLRDPVTPVRAWWVLALSAAACAEEAPDPLPEPARAYPEVAVAPSSGAPPPPVLPLIRPAPGDPRRPPQPYVDAGACPFECCTYREWVAVAPIPAYARERDTTAVAFTLAAGERFEALTGNVHLDPVGVVVVRRPVVWKEGPDSLGRWEPGDTLHVLSYLGEDHFRYWHRGRIVEFFRLWSLPGEPRAAEPEAVLLRRPREDWWAQVRSARGDSGWLRMRTDGAKVGRKDACSVD